MTTPRRMRAPLPSRDVVIMAGRHLDENEGMRLHQQLDATDLSALRVLQQLAVAYVAGDLAETPPADETGALNRLDELCRDQGWTWRAEANTASQCAVEGLVTVYAADGSLGRASSVSGASVAGAADAASGMRLAAEAAVRKITGE